MLNPKRKGLIRFYNTDNGIANILDTKNNSDHICRLSAYQQNSQLLDGQWRTDFSFFQN